MYNKSKVTRLNVYINIQRNMVLNGCEIRGLTYNTLFLKQEVPLYKELHPHQPIFLLHPKS